MRLLLTGVPGTGKSTLAKLLAKMHGFGEIDINATAKEEGLVGRGGAVKLKKLEVALRARIRNSKEKNLVVEGHLGCEMRLPLDVAIVLRCEPEKLKIRLKKRGYRGKKLEDNLLSEALDYCTVMAEKNYGKRIAELDTGKRKIKETAGLILKITAEKKKGDRVDWGAWLERSV